MDAPPVKPLLPVLARLHQPLAPYAYALLRIATGAILVPHGVQELFFRGAAPAGKYLLAWGMKGPLEGAWLLALIELVCGALLVLGLLTRPAALLLVVEMAFATAWHAARGWSWGTGEYPALLLALCVAILFRGGGRFSLDHRIGREF